MSKEDDQDRRIRAILGDEEDTDFDDAVGAFFDHLKANLQLPCDVTGIEDFRWEEPYVFGMGDQDEYEELKKTQPSYEDRYELLEVLRDGGSEWMMFWEEDIAARVRRISDDKMFVLGLAELEVIDKGSPNHQLVDDYAVWFVNAR